MSPTPVKFGTVAPSAGGNWQGAGNPYSLVQRGGQDVFPIGGEFDKRHRRVVIIWPQKHAERTVLQPLTVLTLLVMAICKRKSLIWILPMSVFKHCPDAVSQIRLGGDKNRLLKPIHSYKFSATHPCVDNTRQTGRACFFFNDH